VRLLLLLALPLAAMADEDCVRSAPQPIYRQGNPALAAHSFTPVNSHEAHESAQLRTGAAISIEHGGCESFATRLRFSSTVLAGRKVSPQAAFRAAASALRELKSTGADTTFDLALAAQSLEGVRAPPYGEEYLIGADEDNFLQSRFSVLSAGPGFVEIVLFWPL
jgi:hypothetical protein